MTEAAARAATWRATLFVVLAACGFGSISVLLVVGQRHGLTLASAMAWRYLLATPFLLAIAGAELRTVTARRGATLLVLGGLGQVAVSALSLSALRWIDVATLVDVTGLIIYFTVALLVLRGTLL